MLKIQASQKEGKKFQLDIDIFHYQKCPNLLILFCVYVQMLIKSNIFSNKSIYQIISVCNKLNLLVIQSNENFL